MARIRTIKPEFWTHEDLSALPEATHMLAAALLNHADDEGHFNAHPGLVKAACCPLREPSVSVHDSLKLLSEVGYLKLGTGPDGKRYGRIVTFDDHQRVNRPTLSKIKALGVVWDESVKAHPQLTEDSPPERNREQGKEQGREGTPDKPARTATAARTYLGWLEALPEDQDPLPAGDPVFAYAAKVGIPEDFVALAWVWFENTYGPDGVRRKKRYDDWRAVFRNAVEGNWAKAWYSDGDGYRLTTVGLQLQRSQREAA